MSKVNTLYGLIQENCIKKAKHLIISQMLAGEEVNDEGVFFEVKDASGRLRAVVEYRDHKGEITIVPHDQQLIEKIISKRIKTKYSEDDIRDPVLQGKYLSELVCGS